MKDNKSSIQPVQLKNKDIPEIRSKILKEQEGLCVLCNKPITERSGISLDHQHKLKSSEIGIDGGGLIRGVLCRSCNVQEGKIWNSTQRYIQAKTVQDRIDWLENLIQYYKKENYNIIHPNEAPKPKKLSKKNYNKVKKLYDTEEFIPKRKNQKKKPFPEYPKSGKATKILIELFEKYQIELFN